MENKHLYTFQADLNQRLKNKEFKKEWDGSEAESLWAFGAGALQLEQSGLLLVRAVIEETRSDR